LAKIFNDDASSPVFITFFMRTVGNTKLLIRLNLEKPKKHANIMEIIEVL